MPEKTLRKLLTSISLRIRTLRYGIESKDYFWINDLQPVLIMHPYRHDQEDTDVSQFQNPQGKYLFNDFVTMITRQGSGYANYMWQWKDNLAKIATKTSFINRYTPWGWIIGTGMYVDDVHRDHHGSSQKEQG